MITIFENFIQNELDDKVGKEFWFEYHCWEDEKSSDAELWYHSHQRCKVLSIEEPGIGDTQKERAEEGCPRVYKVEFDDGFIWSCFEDELLESTDEFERPDPPKRKISL